MIGFSIILSTTRHEDDEDDEDEDKDDDAYGVGNIQTRARNIQTPLRSTMNMIKIGSVGSGSG